MMLERFKYLNKFSCNIIVINSRNNVVYANFESKCDEIDINSIINNDNKTIKLNDVNYEFDLQNIIEDDEKYYVLFLKKSNLDQLSVNDYFNEILQNESFYAYRFNIIEDKFDFIGDASQKIISKTKEEILKMKLNDVQDILPKVEWDEIFENVSHFLYESQEKRKSFIVDYKISSDSQYKWLRDSYNVYLNNKNLLSHITGIIVDFTDLKDEIINLSNECSSYKELVNLNLDGHFVINIMKQTVVMSKKLSLYLKNSDRLEYTFDEVSNNLIDTDIIYLSNQLEIKDNYSKIIKVKNYNNDIIDFLVIVNATSKDELGSTNIIKGALINIDKISNEIISAQSQLNNFLQTVLNSIDIGILITNENGNIEFYNESIEQITGIKFKQIAGNHITEIFKELNPRLSKDNKSNEQLLIEIKELLRTGASFSSSNSFISEITDDVNIIKIIEVTTNTFKTESGYRILLTVKNITSQKIQDIEYKEQLNNYIELLEYSREVHYHQSFINSSNNYVSSYIYDMLEYTPDEFLSMTNEEVFELIHPDYREIFRRYHDKNKISEHIPADNTVEYKIKHKNGNYVFVSEIIRINYDDNNKPVNVTGSMRDITQSKLIESKLKETLDNYRIIVDNQSDLLVKVNCDGKFTFVNKKYCEYFGKTQEELIGKSFMPLVHQDDREITAKAMESIYSPPYYCYVEQRVKSKDGWRWVAWKDTAILDNNGDVKEIVAVGRDITEKKSIEQKYENYNKNYREVLTGIKLPILIFSKRNKKILEVNKSCCELLGFSENDLLGKNLDDIVADRNKIPSNIIHSDAEPVPLDLEIKNKSGNKIKLKINFSPVKFSDEDAILGLVEELPVI